MSKKRKTKTTVFYVRDSYDSKKLYVLKQTACHHYYANEEINGKLFYKNFIKINKSWFQTLLDGGDFVMELWYED